jgi:pyrimidine-specific ribonucleoside hydrolase
VAIPVIIDTDPGVDDAVAIALALASPEVEVRALTTLGGNVGLERTTRNAQDLLALAGRSDIPVAAGASRPLAAATVLDAAAAHGQNGLGGVELPRASCAADPRAAVDVMVEVIQASSSPVTVLAIGPLTNLAVLHAAHPSTFARIDRIVMMGGGMHRLGNDALAAEFNVSYDPEAAARVFAAGVPIVMVGLDVTEKAIVRRTDIEPLRAAGPLSQAVASMIDRFMEMDAEWLGERCILHDAVALSYLLEPSLLDVRPYWVGVECTGTLTRGMTVVDVRHFTKRSPNAQVAVDVDARRFVDLLVTRLGPA